MPKGVVFHVLDVGQGDGNFVEVFENGVSSAATHSFLIDFGSAKSARIAGPKSEAFMLERITKVVPATGQNQLTLIALSHSDADHINLMPPFLDACQAHKVTIGMCLYSGDEEYYTYRGKNILQLIKDYPYIASGTRAIRKFADSYSSFNVFGWPAWFVTPTLEVRILIVNAPGKQVTHHRTKRKRNEPNAGSLCLVCSFAGVRVVLTGDATYATFKAMNSLLTDQKATGQVADTVFLKIPHHGSAVTLADEDEMEPYQQAIDFTELCKPVSSGVGQSATASADFHIGFRHPSKAIMDLFSKFATKNGYKSPSGEPDYPKHRYSAYEGGNWHVYPTDVNTYTTMYTKDARVQWSFLIQEDKSIGTGRVPSDAIKLLFHRVTAPFARAPWTEKDRARRRRVLLRARPGLMHVPGGG